jgi:hypothetical protein
VEPSYSAVAGEQLDAILAEGHVELYNSLVVVCEFILDHPHLAQRDSSAIVTEVGIRFRFAVPGHQPYKVFWSSAGPRIEAVFPYPT